MKDPMYERFKFARWTDSHAIQDVRCVLYDKAWEIILESLWTSNEDINSENKDRALNMISSALFVLDEMESK